MNFNDKLKEIVGNFKACKPGQIVLLHHNDVDGLTAGAILSTLCMRLHIPCRRICLEKPYPEAIAQIVSDESLTEDDILMITDFASGMLSKLEEIVAAKLKVFILDHHSIEENVEHSINLLNTREFGIIKGASASTIAYLFAKEIDKDNIDLAQLGILGSLGDGFVDEQGKLTELNLEIYDDACEQNQVHYQEGYEFIKFKPKDSKSLMKALNTLGSISYFKGGPDIAIKILTDGGGEAIEYFSRKPEREFDSILSAFIDSLELDNSKNIQYFTLTEEFSEMGVKTVGLVCEELIAAKKIAQESYVLGFQSIPEGIPGLGDCTLKYDVKISMRVPKKLNQKIINNKMPAIDVLLKNVMNNFDGFIDACHPHAGAVTILKGTEKELIKAIQLEIDNFIG